MNKKNLKLLILIVVGITLLVGCDKKEPLKDAAKVDQSKEKSSTGTFIPLQNYYAENLVYKDKLLITDLKRGKLSKKVDKTQIETGIKELEKVKFVSSFLVMQHGKLVEERYFEKKEQEDAQNIHSASKSILSALTGIAIRDGYIKSVDDSIANYLPAEYFTGTNESKKAITIKHLLNMTTGLAWEENSTENIIQKRKDWVKAILDQKLIYTPGKMFNYSTGNAQVLAEVLTRATGMDLKTYGDKVLFSKLGITVDHWRKDPYGTYAGGCNFFITPYEMAKFGQLYLDKGVWKGKQIVPKEWVESSFITTSTSMHEYGYCWWVKTVKGYTTYNALGYAGQCIHIVPELDLVVVTTTDTNESLACADGGLTSFYVLKNFIIPELIKEKGQK